MSPSRIDPESVRLQRSELSVPGSRPDMFEKALASAADCVLLDLEDAVSPDDKEQARRNVIQAVNDLDWRAAGKTISVRVNGMDTDFFYRDMADVLEQAGRGLDTVLLPKAGAVADIHLADRLIARLGSSASSRRPIGLEAQIETAAGLVNVDRIAAAGGRLEALHLGAGDLAASLRARTAGIGALNPDYPGDPWHAALSRLAAACRAAGIRPVDGPFGDFSDREGFLAAARRSAALGFEGKWAIHPSQVPLANEVFSPTEDEVRHARRILEALAQAEARGQGAVRLDDQMIDAASARMAGNVVAVHERLQGQ